MGSGLLQNPAVATRRRGCPEQVHGCPVQHLPQPGAGAADHRDNQNSPWPDLFRPPTSSKKAVWTAAKAWMTGTSPVKGTWRCSRGSANNRLLSTGRPWNKSGHGGPNIARSPAALSYAKANTNQTAVGQPRR